MRTAKQTTETSKMIELQTLIVELNDVLFDDEYAQGIFLAAFAPRQEEIPTFLNPDNGKELNF